MLAPIALICLALVCSASAHDIPHGEKRTDVGRFQWFQNYIQAEMAKSEEIKEAFEPILDRDSFMLAPCSFQVLSYVRSTLEFVYERFPNTLAAEYVKSISLEKMNRCIGEFDEHVQKMPYLMFEWSFDEFFRRIAKLPRKPKPADSALLETAVNFVKTEKASESEEVCQLAAALNQLRKNEKAGPKVDEMIRGERALGGPALTSWHERVDENLKKEKPADCKQEVREFLVATCRSESVDNHAGPKFIDLFRGQGNEPTLADRTNKYYAYNYICVGPLVKPAQQTAA